MKYSVVNQLMCGWLTDKQLSFKPLKCVSTAVGWLYVKCNYMSSDDSL